MGSEKTDRLSPEEAKQRLHQAVGDLGLRTWVKRRPYEALTTSFVVGLILATTKPMRDTMLRLLLRII